MRYEFHPDALEEYNQTGYYYARKEPGLDLRFIVAIEKAIDAILENPLRYRFIEEDSPLPGSSVSLCDSLYD